MKDTIAKSLLPYLLLAGLIVPVFEALAEDTPRIHILGLFRDKAMLKINGDSVLLKVGGEAKHGARLIRSNSSLAVLEINGQQKEYRLGSSGVTTRMSSPKMTVVRIPSQRGMFKTSGMINGRSVDLLVDTGASVVAMARPTADRLQIQYREIGKPMQVSTASQLHDAWHVKLNSVTVGGITLRQVDGTVIDTDHDQETLLGMSFLGRVKFSQEQGLVILEAKAP